MTTVNVHEAKTHLSRLLEKVERGEEVVIARDGQPVARLVAVRRKRELGRLAGKWDVPESFFDPLPEDVLAAFGPPTAREKKGAGKTSAPRAKKKRPRR